MAAHKAYIWRETLVSVGINLAINLLAFYLTFGFGKAVTVWGMGAWVFDFLPQSFMVTLMCIIVPGALATRAVRGGKLARSNHHSRLPRNLLLRALLLSICTAAIGTAVMALLAMLSGLESIAFVPALSIKLAYAAIVAALVTPVGLRAVLAANR